MLMEGLVRSNTLVIIIRVDLHCNTSLKAMKRILNNSCYLLNTYYMCAIFTFLHLIPTTLKDIISLLEGT